MTGRIKASSRCQLNRAPEPQPRKDRHGGRHPDRSGLRLGIQLIGLDLADVDLPLADQLFLDLAGLLAGFALPIGDRALIEPKGKDHRRDGTAAGAQGQHDTDHPEWMFEPEQRRAGGLGKGLAAGMANVAAFFARMDANVVACATGRVGTYYQLRTHRRTGGIEHTPNLPMRSVLSSQLHAVLRRYRLSAEG